MGWLKTMSKIVFISLLYHSIIIGQEMLALPTTSLTLSTLLYECVSPHCFSLSVYLLPVFFTLSPFLIYIYIYIVLPLSPVFFPLLCICLFVYISGLSFSSFSPLFSFLCISLSLSLSLSLCLLFSFSFFSIHCVCTSHYLFAPFFFLLSYCLSPVSVCVSSSSSSSSLFLVFLSLSLFLLTSMCMYVSIPSSLFLTFFPHLCVRVCVFLYLLLSLFLLFSVYVSLSPTHECSMKVNKLIFKN